MANFKQSRWTKVHAQGEGNFESKNNVLDITVGANRYQADVTYETSLVRNFEKAAYWLLRGLTNANAELVAQIAADELKAKTAEAGKETESITASGEGWNCTIENMGAGVFKASMSWTFGADGQMTINDEPAPEKPKRTRKSGGTRKPRSSKKNAEAVA